MTAYACGSGGVIFVEEEIAREAQKEQKKVAIRRSNDNAVEAEAE